MVVTADDDGYARIFYASNGQQVGKPFGVSGGNMNAAAFSPDGTRIVTASGDGYAQVWNASQPESIGDKFGFGSSMNSAEFSHDGTEILTTENDGYTDIWDATQTTPSFDRNPGAGEQSCPTMRSSARTARW